MIKLVAFDLDGTLTQHKSKLEQKPRDVLSAILGKYQAVMVCAGGCGRVCRQMDGFPIDIIGFYGMERSTFIKGTFQIVDKVRAINNEEEVTTKIKWLRNNLKLLDYEGNSIEFHKSGIITFPLLGTDAPLDKKLAFDPDRHKRRGYYEKVCEIFDGYNVFIGGSSSFDIAPKPYCKLYALRQYLTAYGVGENEVVYFGDDYGPGGNDRDIYSSNIRFIPIDDYRDFPRIAKEVLL